MYAASALPLATEQQKDVCGYQVLTLHVLTSVQVWFSSDVTRHWTLGLEDDPGPRLVPGDVRLSAGTSGSMWLENLVAVGCVGWDVWSSRGCYKFDLPRYLLVLLKAGLFMSPSWYAH